MNFDFYLDPPDHPEPPDWYTALEDVLEVMSPPESVAEAIRKALDAWNQEQAAQHDPDPEWEQNVVYDPFPEEEGYPKENTCRHGNPHGDCDTCDHLSDIAYDEARERKFFGR
jgi:hypothetical protein